MAQSPQKENSTSIPLTGSERCPFKLAIIGGGPSGCSIVVRAMRIGVDADLCGFSYMESPPAIRQTPYLAGVCIIERGSVARFGGGTLQDYIINSNTYIGKFVTNVVTEKPDNLPPEHTKGTPLERLGSIPSARELERIGNRTGSLSSVGVFLRDVGQTVMTVVQQHTASRCMTGVNVDCIQQVVDENGSFSCWKIALSRGINRGNGEDVISSTTDSSSLVEWIYAKHVALATGGHQEIPRFSTSAMNSKIITSDVVCTSEGVELLKSRIRRNIKAGGNGRVAIIGGSHSALSAAWICLNKVDESDPRKSMPVSPSKASSSTKSVGVAGDPCPKIIFGSSSICILHRSSIKVFYATRAEAEQDGYADICVNKITGQINPFGGIRGDAKELWSRVRSAKEPRVRMLQIRSNIGTTSTSESSFGGVKQSIVDKILEEAAVIIWACGYTTNLIPVYNSTGETIRIARDKGQVSVDDQARVLVDDPIAQVTPLSPSRGSNRTTQSAGEVVQNLYGSGLGYGLRATLDNGEPDGASGRADGVAVYLKRGATLVLGHVLGDKVFGGMGIKSWEERNAKLRKLAFATRGRSHSESSDDENNKSEDELEPKAAVSPTRLSDRSPTAKKAAIPRGKLSESPMGARRSFCGSPLVPTSQSGSEGQGSVLRPLSTGRAQKSKSASCSPALSNNNSTACTSRSLTPHSALRGGLPRGSGSTAVVAQRKASIPSKDHLNLIKRMEALTESCKPAPSAVGSKYVPSSNNQQVALLRTSDLPKTVK